MSLEHVEIYGLANHLGNQDPIRANLPFGFGYSLPRPPGTPNIAGAVGIGNAKVEGGIYNYSGRELKRG